MNHKIEEQLSRRKSDQLARLWSEGNADILFLCSSSDLGVCRNGGRRGARFAPEAIRAVLGKMVFTGIHPRLAQIEVAHPKLEEENFEQAQRQSGLEIKRACEHFGGNTIVQLGGGHDHIFPLLSAFSQESSIHVINIDAHLDTRQDKAPHSGTPFRQFAQNYTGRFRLTQLGIHSFANAPAAHEGLKAEMRVISQRQLMEMNDEQWKSALAIDNKELTILSLDCDALPMEAVSAVNARGLPMNLVEDIFRHYKQLPQEKKIYGIYEYNPLYDNLSQKDARSLAALLYDTILPD